MLIISGEIGIPGGVDDTILAAVAEVVAASQAEAGCIAYDFWVHPTDPTRLRVYEEWQDMDAIKAHGKSAHMARWQEFQKGLGPISRDVKIVETGRITPI